MLVCDYCGEPIEGNSTTLSGTVPMSTTIRVDLHPECVVEFAKKAPTIKGKRPAGGK